MSFLVLEGTKRSLQNAPALVMMRAGATYEYQSVLAAHMFPSKPSGPGYKEYSMQSLLPEP
jgi:hypothetical protein